MFADRPDGEDLPEEAFVFGDEIGGKTLGQLLRPLAELAPG
jgi:hypothetical protein